MFWKNGGERRLVVGEGSERCTDSILRNGDGGVAGGSGVAGGGGDQRCSFSLFAHF